MSSRELYEYALIECNKLEAPAMLLEDYNYFINKSVQQYINRVYNRYDTKQQSTDDLRVLRTSAVIPLYKGGIGLGITDDGIGDDFTQSALYGESYIGELPKDYLHMLSCIVEYNIGSAVKCADSSSGKLHYAARRLPSDTFAGIINNAYMRPSYKRPYYCINSWNGQIELPTNSIMDEELANADYYDSTKPAQGRAANSTRVLMEIRFGNDSSKYTPDKAYVDYLKAPQYIRLTQSQIDQTEDTSQILEFPDYVCFEIVNIFTTLLLENASDPRLQTNVPINQTIPSGAEQASKK